MIAPEECNIPSEPINLSRGEAIELLALLRNMRTMFEPGSRMFIEINLKIHLLLSSLNDTIASEDAINWGRHDYE